MLTPIQALQLALDELKALNVSGWEPIAIWANRARPLLLQHFPTTLTRFDELTKEPYHPGRAAGPREQIIIPSLKRQRHQEDQEAEKTYPARVHELRETLVALLEGAIVALNVTPAPNSAAGRLAVLLNELKKIPPRPWSEITSWAANAKPLIVKAFPSFVGDFQRHSAPPKWEHYPRVYSMSREIDPYGGRPGTRQHDDVNENADVDAAEEQANLKLATAQKGALVSCIQGIIAAADIDAPALAKESDPGRGVTHLYQGPVHHGDHHSTSIANSSVGAFSTGAGSSAAGGVTTITGDTRLTQKEYRTAISCLQATLLGMQDKLDSIDRDLYEDSSNLLRAIRKLQLGAGADPTSVVPASHVHAAVADAFDEDEYIKATVTKMKPGALARVADTTKDLAKLAEDPLVKFIAGAIATAAAAHFSV